MTVPKARHLNQILSIEAGVRKNLEKTKTALHRTSSKPELYEGMSQTYSPVQEEGEQQPPRNKKVQQRAEDVLSQLSSSLQDIFDVVCTKDTTNCVASANVELDGVKYLENVPVPYLLFMEKQMDDLHKFVEAMPTLDLSVEWKFNEGRRAHTSEKVRTNSSRREKVNHVKFEGDDNHPPQVEMIDNEVLVGYWDTLRFSGAFTDNRKHQIIGRIMTFKNAVKFAREKANQTEAINQEVGAKVMGFILAD